MMYFVIAVDSLTGSGSGGGSAKRRKEIGQLMTCIDTATFLEFAFHVVIISSSDATYVDPLGDLPPRPKTASKRQQDEDDFQNAELDDDLLPE